MCAVFPFPFEIDSQRKSVYSPFAFWFPSWLKKPENCQRSCFSRKGRLLHTVMASQIKIQLENSISSWSVFWFFVFLMVEVKVIIRKIPREIYIPKEKWFIICLWHTQVIIFHKPQRNVNSMNCNILFCYMLILYSGPLVNFKSIKYIDALLFSFLTNNIFFNNQKPFVIS